MPTTQQQWTVFWTALAITAVIVAVDVAACQCWGPDSTFSRIFCRICRAYPTVWTMFAVWVGILLGHLMPCR